MNKKKILYFISEDSFFCSHRLPLAVAAVKKGYNVSLVTKVSTYGEYIKKQGINLIHFDINRSSINLFRCLKSIKKLVKIYKQEKPDLVHHVAIKNIIIGSISAYLSGVKHVVNAITGMGYIYISKKKKVRILRFIINICFKILLNKKNTKVIMQNKDDLCFLSNSGIVKNDQMVLIRGAGVDTNEFLYQEDIHNEYPIIIFPSRLLLDKGINEFIAAANILKKEGIKARFVLVGYIDHYNHSSISEDILKEYIESGDIEWWGNTLDMANVFTYANIVCLPSYREGLPKVLLEAASCGLPIVTTDTVGCREVVIDGKNGFLVPVYSKDALAHALKKLILDADLRKKMGLNGRNLVIKEFTIEKVVSETLLLYRECLQI